MPYDIDTEPIVITVPAQTVAPEGNVTAAEWLDYKSRVSAIEGIGLSDLADVDLTDKAHNRALIWSDTYSVWVARDIAQPVNAQIIGDDASQFGPVEVFAFGNGIKVEQHPTYAFMASVSPLFGTAVNTVAAGNHVHSLPGDVRLSIPASGALSASSRTLVSGTRSGLIPANTYLIGAELTGDLQGQGTGAGYTNISITIGTTTQGRFQRVRTVAGVPREYSFSHTGVHVTGVSSVAVSASISWSEGDPIDVQAGELIITARSNR